MLSNRQKIYKVLQKDGRTNNYANENAFFQKYFINEDSVLDLYNFLISHNHKTGNLIGQRYVDYDKTTFFKKYACDLEWAKKTSYCTIQPKPEEIKKDNTPEEKTISTTQQQQNLVDKGYFIGTSGPNKNGVDGVPGKKTQYAQHALDSGIDSATYNNIYKQQNPDLTQTIENLFGKQTPKEIPNNTGKQTQDGSAQTVTQPQNSPTPQQKAQVQKARVIKTINPNDW